MKKEINLGTSFDVNYAKMFINTMYSILKNTDSYVNFYFILDKEDTSNYIRQTATDKLACFDDFQCHFSIMNRRDVEYFSKLDIKSGTSMQAGGT